MGTSGQVSIGMGRGGRVVWEKNKVGTFGNHTHMHTHHITYTDCNSLFLKYLKLIFKYHIIPNKSCILGFLECVCLFSSIVLNEIWSCSGGRMRIRKGIWLYLLIYISSSRERGGR